MSKAIVSALNDSEVLRMACRQFDAVADATLVKAKDSVEYQRRKFKFGRRLAALTLGFARVAEAKKIRGLFP